ncbi:hypothetical protein T492DRAFT_902466 [Pavlovales sp. CCMP2436]|nr:hypothetical protein T492DRAFT_902466 [Pavlovales sp. CCMP2436]
MANGKFVAIKVERTLASEASVPAWCPSMDLLALVAGERQLAVHRLSWQRLFTVSAFEHALTAIAWRPDGKMVAVGLADGSLCLFSVEDGALLATVPPDGGRGVGRTVALAWHEQLTEAVSEARHAGAANDRALLAHWGAGLGGFELGAAGFGGADELPPAPYGNQLGDLFWAMPPLPKQPGRLLDSGSAGKLESLVERQLLFARLAGAPLDVVTNSFESGEVQLRASGKQLLARVRLASLCTGGGSGSGTLPRVLRCCLSACLGQLVVLFALPAEQLQGAHVGPMLGLPTAEAAASLDVHDGGRLGVYCAVFELPLLRERAPELQQGAASGALELFLSAELSDTAVAKLGKGLGAARQQLALLGASQLQPACEMAAHVLHALEALVGWEARFAPLALPPARVRAALQAAWRLRAAVGQMLRAADAALAELSALVAWLGWAAFAVRGEAPAAGSRGPPPKLDKVVAFLRDGGGVAAVRAAHFAPPSGKGSVGAQGGGGGLGALGRGASAAPPPDGSGLHCALLRLHRLVLGADGAVGGPAPPPAGGRGGARADSAEADGEGGSEGGAGSLLAPMVAALSASVRLAALQPLCTLSAPPSAAGGAGGLDGARLAALSPLLDLAPVELRNTADAGAPFSGAAGQGGARHGVLALFPASGVPAAALGLCLVRAPSAASDGRPTVQLGRLPVRVADGHSGEAAASCAALYTTKSASAVVLVAHSPAGDATLAVTPYDLAAGLAAAPLAPRAPSWPCGAWVAGLSAGAPTAVRTFDGLTAERVAVSATRGLACLLCGRRVVTLDLEEDAEGEGEEEGGEAEGQDEGDADEHFTDAIDEGGGDEEEKDDDDDDDAMHLT